MNMSEFDSLLAAANAAFQSGNYRLARELGPRIDRLSLSPAQNDAWEGARREVANLGLDRVALTTGVVSLLVILLAQFLARYFGG